MPHTLNLDANLLAAMDDLSLLARTVVEGFFDGLHRSPFLGHSSEFSAYRAYTQGDNLRHIDWKVWGRSDKFYVKQFEDNTNVRCQIFLDNSASMDFGAGDFNKFNYGRILAAVLAHLMVRQHDAPGLIFINDRAIQAVPTQASRHHAEEIFVALTNAKAEGRTAVGEDLLGLLHTLSRRGIAVVISDFFSPDETALELLRGLHSQHQEVIVFHLLAPEEIDLPYDGEFIMEDSESGVELPVHADEFRVEYQKRVNDFCDHIRGECVKLEIDYQQIRTDAPFDGALVAYLEKRGSV